MKVADYIYDRVGRLAKGYVFTYGEFIREAHQKEAAIKAMNRMAAGGVIRRLSKGQFC